MLMAVPLKVPEPPVMSKAPATVGSALPLMVAVRFTALLVAVAGAVAVRRKVSAFAGVVCRKQERASSAAGAVRDRMRMRNSWVGLVTDLMVVQLLGEMRGKAVAGGVESTFG